MPQPNAVKCLVVDDEPRLRRVLVRLLEGEGFTCAEAGSGTEALEMLQHDPVPLVISDLRMPQMDGVTLLREIIARWPTTAVIVVTAVAEVESAVACLQLGALDYVAKPFHLDEVRARVMQALDKRSLKMEVEDYRHNLEQRVHEQARRIEELSLERLQALVHFLEEKDPYTSGHSVRVADYSARIGRQLGLDQPVMDAIALGAELHDIGKIGVSDVVLHKAGKLTDAEYRHIMEHPGIGARILAPLMRDVPTALAIVRSHHERLDGKGFPDGLKGDQIPLEVRVVAVADSFDAMTSLRPYRPALSVQKALQELEEGKGTQFHPPAVDAFLAAFPDLSALPVTTPEVRPLHLPSPPVPRRRSAPLDYIAGMTDTLMVGVSGVRGIVGKDLTPDVVTRWAAAFGTWVHERGKGDEGRGTRAPIVVGRDARASGPAFAAAVTAGLTSVGCDVVDVGLVPTPTVQLAVEHHRAGGGIAITASHNPIEWNALKFIGPDGIFLDGADGKRVAELVGEDGGGRGRTGAVTTDTRAVERHLDAVLKLPAVDVEAIRARKYTVALDAVRGAGGPVMRTLLEHFGCEVAGINLETDGRFPRAPEPIPENLGGLSTLVRRSGAALGIAVDPDVDRLAIVDENGAPIGEDYTLAFAIRTVLGGKRETGNGKRVVVCNLSTSLVVEDAARECGAEVVRTPVGEVHVARAILRLGAVIGGEGNGGVMYPALHAGRDAPVAAALLLTLLARGQARVSELVAAAPRYAIVKAKMERGAGSGEQGLTRVYAELRRRFPDARADTQDGLRLAWRDRWLHLRPSNTEPIIRLIAEAPSGADAQQLVDEGRRVCAGS